MKARRVKRLDPDGPLADNVARIVTVRLDELCGFMPRAAHPEQVTALHDMRIAAKRLRYVLELFAPSFGPYAATAAKSAKQLQDLIGEIHDCDVTLPRVEGIIDDLRAQDAEAVRRLAADAEDLDPAVTAAASTAAAYRGLETLDVHLRARRALLFDRFLELWQRLAEDGFRARLELALAERPRDATITSASHFGNGPAPTEGLPSEPSPL